MELNEQLTKPKVHENSVSQFPLSPNGVHTEKSVSRDLSQKLVRQ
jgi:hypothetical protein